MGPAISVMKIMGRITEFLHLKMGKVRKGHSLFLKGSHLIGPTKLLISSTIFMIFTVKPSNILNDFEDIGTRVSQQLFK